MEFEVIITNEANGSGLGYYQYNSIKDAEEHLNKVLIQKYTPGIYHYSGMTLKNGVLYKLHRKLDCSYRYKIDKNKGPLC